MAIDIITLAHINKIFSKLDNLIKQLFSERVRIINDGEGNITITSSGSDAVINDEKGNEE